MKILIGLFIIVYFAYLIFKITIYFTVYSNSRKLNKILDTLNSKKKLTEKTSEVIKEADSEPIQPPPVHNSVETEIKRPPVSTTSDIPNPEVKTISVDAKSKSDILSPVDAAVSNDTLPNKNPVDFTQTVIEKKVAGILSRIWNWIIVGEEFRNPNISLEYAVASTWLLRIAILFIIIGIAFLLKYSIENAMLGPYERLGLSVVAGIIMLISGIKLLKSKYQIIGQGLLGGSIAIFYFSAFASSMMYHLISTKYAFGVLILVTIFSGALAVILDSLLVAILASIGGYLTPLILNTGFDNKLLIFCYLLILGIGVLSIARYKRWKLLNALSFVFTYLIFLIATNTNYNKHIDFKVAIIFATVFFLMFSAITVIYNLVNKEKSTVLELIGMFFNAAIYFITTYFLITDLFPRECVAYVSIGLALFYSFGVVLLYTREIKDNSLMIFFIGFAAFFITISVPILLTNKWMTSAWAIQSLIFLWMSSKLKNKFLRGIAYTVYFITFIKVISVDFDDNFINVHTINYTSELISRLLTFGSLIISMALGYNILRKESKFERNVQSSFFIWTTSIFTFVYLHFEFYYLCGTYYKPLTNALTSLIWVGAILLVLRKISTQRSVFKVMLSLLIIGILIKLFLFDAFFPTRFIYGGSYNTERFLIRLLNYALVNFAVFSAYIVTSKNNISTKSLFAVSSLGLLFLYATFELNTFLHTYLPAFQSGGISILWALFAIAFIFSGIKANLKSMRFTGLILFAVCALKVFFSDLSQLSSLYKIFASIALGIVILAGSFVYVKFVEKFSTEEKIQNKKSANCD